ncbi:MAG: STAS domain-containing protein [Magnetococcales bacterium]|nr:STAS domain-containing protein [Magnetococcales bacterium]
MMEEAGHGAERVLRLPGRATIREVSGLRDQLLELLNQGDQVVLDCSDVEQSDLSLVQLIIAVRRTTGGDEGLFRVILPPSGPVAEQIRYCGLEHEFTELWNG